MLFRVYEWTNFSGMSNVQNIEKVTLEYLDYNVLRDRIKLFAKHDYDVIKN